MNDHPRPGCGYWLLALLTAALCVMQIISALRVLQLPDALAAQISLLPPLEFLASGLWGGVFGLTAYRMIWQKTDRQRSARSALAAITAFAVYSAARLAVFARADYDRERLPILLAAVGLLCLVSILVLSRPGRRSRN